MEKRRVLLIGWRSSAVTALQRLGTEVTCVLAATDDRKRANLLDDAHAIAVDDPANIESTMAGLERRGVGVTDFDVVCSQQEHALVPAAVLGGTRCRMTRTTALALRDKDLQKRRIRAAGIAVAETQVIVQPSDLVHFSHRR